MKIIPLTLEQANAVVAKWHRHHKPVRGHRFSLGAKQGEEIVGAAIIGRPVARLTDQYNVAEVTRLVTNGTKNACSILYAAAARIAREMGFQKIQTFILDSESGVSLRASGWEFEITSAGGEGWQSRANRRSDQPTVKKHRYAKILND